MRFTLLLTAAALASAAACDGAVDEGDQITCSAQLTITGSAALEPQPPDISGCWPVGTWTFQVAIAANTCNPAPTPLAQYQIKVERDLASPEPDHTYIYSYLTDPADTTAHVSTTSGGGGLCEGEVLVYADNGLSVWNMHPALQAGGALTGIGDFETHTTNQIPQQGN
ncbi:MAG: hypothetical protein R3B06_29570 [Kofleriaceae bacterium]